MRVKRSVCSCNQTLTACQGKARWVKRLNAGFKYNDLCILYRLLTYGSKSPSSFWRTQRLVKLVVRDFTVCKFLQFLACATDL